MLDPPDMGGGGRHADPGSADAAETEADAAEILRTITRIGYLITRARRHDLVKTVAAVPLDR